MSDNMFPKLCHGVWSQEYIVYLNLASQVSFHELGQMQGGCVVGAQSFIAIYKEQQPSRPRSHLGRYLIINIKVFM